MELDLNKKTHMVIKVETADGHFVAEYQMVISKELMAIVNREISPDQVIVVNNPPSSLNSVLALAFTGLLSKETSK